MELVKYVVWQYEIAKSGAPHLQGYFVVHEQHGQKGRVSPKWVKDKINGKMHIEKRMGTHQQAIDYCKKTDTRVKGPWEHGTHVDEIANKALAGEKKKKTLNDVKDQIDSGVSQQDLWDNNFVMMTHYSKAFEKYAMVKLQGQARVPSQNFVFWGPPGTGKTHRVLDALDKLNATAYWYRPGVNGAWFDGYDPIVHNAVVFDEFKGKLDFFFFFFFFFFNLNFL